MLLFLNDRAIYWACAGLKKCGCFARMVRVFAVDVCVAVKLLTAFNWLSENLLIMFYCPASASSSNVGSS